LKLIILLVDFVKLQFASALLSFVCSVLGFPVDLALIIELENLFSLSDSHFSAAFKRFKFINVNLGVLSDDFNLTNDFSEVVFGKVGVITSFPMPVALVPG
jgi:hypothetical protein